MGNSFAAKIKYALAALALAAFLAGLAAPVVLWPRSASAQEEKKPDQKNPAAADKKKDAGDKGKQAKGGDKAKDGKGKKDGAAKGQGAEAAKEPAQEKPPAGVDPRVMALIDQQRERLALEKAELERERQELTKLKADVTKRVEELKKVQTALEALVKAEQKKRKERVMQLVKVLGNMRPASAGAVVAKLDDRMAVEVFRLMQSRIAGKVMAALEPGQAARISKKLARDKETRAAERMAEEAAEAAEAARQAPPAATPAKAPKAKPKAPAAKPKAPAAKPNS